MEAYIQKQKHVQLQQAAHRCAVHNEPEVADMCALSWHANSHTKANPNNFMQLYIIGGAPRCAKTKHCQEAHCDILLQPCAWFFAARDSTHHHITRDPTYHHLLYHAPGLQDLRLPQMRPLLSVLLASQLCYLVRYRTPIRHT